jgi:hypothetical protein
MRGNLHGHVQTILNAVTRGSSINEAVFSLDFPCENVNFLLVVTNVTGTSPTLDAYIQFSNDGGTTWFDFLHFTQISPAPTWPQGRTCLPRARSSMGPSPT